MGKGTIIIYQSEDGQTRIEVKLQEETLWLTQAQICELYHTSKSNVSEHIKHILEEGELTEESTVRKFRTVANNGKTYDMTYYSLDMIISLGYRIKSIIATRFRQWATERIKEYMIKGFTMDDERLKNLGGGSVSHQDAMDKALAEYRKYQVRTLSPVEEAYLETIRELNRKARHKDDDPQGTLPLD